MSKRPILVLQMQRMGDLILSFPLFLWLERTYPGHPVWVVAEEKFFRPLMPISPKVTYFPWEGLGVLRREKYELIVNLSIRSQAAALAGELEAGAKIGPVSGPQGATYILGDWQLYRSSVVENNRHNLFHWADLNALDCIPLSRIGQTVWPQPRTLQPTDNRIGLFLGASEESKRPSVEFWASLCAELLGRGMRPVLFGGTLEQETGQAVARIFGGPVLDMSGKLKLGELAAVGQSLQLFITPDTGPMHLAAWAGMKVLNLSLGNVNPWETGPYQNDHYVIRSTMSCALGCWNCRRDSLYCHGPFTPSRIAVIAKRMILNDRSGLTKINMPGLRLYSTARGGNGLYDLQHISGRKASSGDMLGRFWQQFFGAAFGLWDTEEAGRIWSVFENNQPKLAGKMRSHLPLLGKEFSKGLAKGIPLPDCFWDSCPLILRQFSGFIHLFLQNNDYSRPAWVRVLSLYEQLASLVSSR
ncbi:glycosyltransferase family 9 protein [Maridesulfovibrio hydrothermalis]|uniref:Glycosyl transferase family 9 n=1 Tax=Maridesulfovibrio hydrothermalis AM13 = DSM 14728 TaxID=1121451 RepID=L0RAP2_9BACT|nr:glycosyltransferase family 9 protein [Maridesulfovibrio hydrothermalis]CCO23843.1 Glycosyl transferase family 9 [Maridesulfovibrio hydrothermalis AM13 = DSM 14728]